MGWPKGKPRSPETRQRLSETRRKLHADPEFAARNAERAAERMRKLNADPEFAARLKVAAKAAYARRCEMCFAKHSARYPVIRSCDEDGEAFYACRDTDHCDAAFTGAVS